MTKKVAASGAPETLELALRPQRQPGEARFKRPAPTAKYLGIGLSTLWALARDREKTGFPAPIKLSPKVTLFDISRIEAFLEQQGVAA